MAAGIRWAYSPPTSMYKRLVGYGYNVASINWRPPREWSKQRYLDVLRAAEQAGIQLMPWMGWSASSIQKVMSWIGQSPVIWGWYSHDEPLAGGATVEGQEGVYNALKQYDPHRRPVVTTFTNARSEDWARAWAPHTFDIAAFDLYPYAMSPDDPEYYLSYWANRLAVYFIEAGKQVIPMMQGYTHPGTPSPKIIPQWQWWQASRMPLYPNSYSVYGSEVHSQAAELARLLGWEPPPPPPPEYTCPHCTATFTSQAELDAHIASEHPSPPPLPPEIIGEIRDSYWAQGFQVWRWATIVDDSENGADSGYVAKIEFTHAWTLQASMMAQYGFENREYDISVRIRGTSDNIRWGVYDRTSSTWIKAEASLYGITNEYRVLHLGKFSHLWSNHDIYLYLAGKDDHVYYIDWFLFKSDAEEKYLPTAPPAPPVYSCPYCPATFGSQAELDDHIASVHPPVLYTCPHCGLTFGTQAELDIHIASEHPVFTCPDCGATFGSQAELDTHITSEHPAPVYECPHCGLTFATQVELEAHVASEHPAAPVFKCIYCGGIFASQAELDDHVASEHPVAAEVVPWYKSGKTYLLLGGLGTLITGIGIAVKRRKK